MKDYEFIAAQHRDELDRLHGQHTWLVEYHRAVLETIDEVTAVLRSYQNKGPAVFREWRLSNGY